MSYILVLMMAAMSQTYCQENNLEQLRRNIALLTMSDRDSAMVLLESAESLAIKTGNIDFQLFLKTSRARITWLNNDFKKALTIYKDVVKEADNTANLTHRIRGRHWLCMFYNQMGKLDSALYYAIEAESIAQDNWLIVKESHKAGNQTQLGLTYLYLAKYDKSIYHFKQANSFTPSRNTIQKSIIYLRLAQAYLGTEKADSFIVYRDMYNHIINKDPNSNSLHYHEDGIFKNFLGEINTNQLISILPVIKKQSKPYQILNTYSLLAQEFLKNEQFGEALIAADSSLHFCKIPKFKIGPLQYRYKALYGLERFGEAYIALEEFHMLNNKMINENSIANIDRLMVEYESEKKDKELIKKQLKLNKSNNSKNLLTVISILLILLLFGLWQLYRRISVSKSLSQNKHEKEVSRLELASLRAQMNPHFLFNTLNSINWYIIKNKSVEASKYLTKFSKLMRLILENSKEDTITLTKELQTLKLYIEMEALRFEGQFYYTQHISDKIGTDNIQVPPLVIQPFVENAIWHGLVHKDAEGHIRLDISVTDNQLLITIEDNGIGRVAALEINNKMTQNRVSSGIQITTDRIIGLNKFSSQPVKIIDLSDENGNALGTRVEILLPYHNY